MSPPRPRAHKYRKKIKKNSICACKHSGRVRTWQKEPFCKKEMIHIISEHMSEKINVSAMFLCRTWKRSATPL